jgi:fermentation-respiration switch protein FrsA (DUF1100 family)
MIKILIYVVVLVCFMIGYVKYVENTKIYFPLKEIVVNPGFINFEFENVYVETADNIKLNGWFIPADNAQYTILFFHGNGGNIADRLDKIMIFHEMGLNMFIIDYRGYGRSEGRPSEKGLYLDAGASYYYLIKERGIEPEQIILYGESLGGAVAINLASKVSVGAVISEGLFGSMRDAGRKLYPVLSLFVISNKFNSLALVKEITVPKLFIHSKTDEIIPFSLGKKLYDAAIEPKQMVELEGGHNDAFLESKEKYVSEIKKFIEEEVGDGLAPSR